MFSVVILDGTFADIRFQCIFLVRERGSLNLLSSPFVFITSDDINTSNSLYSSVFIFLCFKIAFVFTNSIIDDTIKYE